MSNNLKSTKIILKDYYNWQVVARAPRCNAQRERLRLLSQDDIEETVVTVPNEHLMFCSLSSLLCNIGSRSKRVFFPQPQVVIRSCTIRDKITNRVNRHGVRLWRRCRERSFCFCFFIVRDREEELERKRDRQIKWKRGRGREKTLFVVSYSRATNSAGIFPRK